MPIDRPSAENSPEIVLTNYLQLLSGCLVLALLLCLTIFAYTNQLKQSLTYSEVSAGETIAPSQISGATVFEGVAPAAQLQTAALLLTAQNKSGSAREQTSANDLASSKTGFTKHFLRKQTPKSPASDRNVNPALSRTWARSDFPGHAKAALIAIWHQSLKKHRQHGKE